MILVVTECWMLFGQISKWVVEWCLAGCSQAELCQSYYFQVEFSQAEIEWCQSYFFQAAFSQAEFFMVFMTIIVEFTCSVTITWKVSQLLREKLLNNNIHSY